MNGPKTKQIATLLLLLLCTRIEEWRAGDELTLTLIEENTLNKLYLTCVFALVSSYIGKRASARREQTYTFYIDHHYYVTYYSHMCLSVCDDCISLTLHLYMRFGISLDSMYTYVYRSSGWMCKQRSKHSSDGISETRKIANWNDIRAMQKCARTCAGARARSRK